MAVLNVFFYCSLVLRCLIISESSSMSDYPNGRKRASLLVVIQRCVALILSEMTSFTSRQMKPSVRPFSAMTKRVPMTLFSVISSFLMKMVFDPMQKGARECAPLPPKGELLVDLKSCHLASDPDSSSLGVGAGHWVRKRPRWRCSYRFSSTTTLRHVISAVSTCHWRSLAFLA